MRFIDFFSGIGGFRLGMEMAGHKCVGHCEIDKYADASYRAMHIVTDEELNQIIKTNNPIAEIRKEKYLHGEWYSDDIRRVNPAELPEAECYCFGFPCQSFSMAGLKRGLDETRGTLFFEIMRLVEERHPKYLFAENVRGLLSNNKGATFGTVITTMAELGYYVEWQVLNSKYYVPQHRERVYIIGHFRGRSGRKIFPITRNSTEVALHKGVGGEEQGIKQIGNIVKGKNFSNPQRGRIYSPDGICPALNTVGGGGLEPKILKDGRIRKLTPREFFRLQGIDDDLFDRAAKINSDSQLYKQAGNSVTVNVIYDIARRM